MSTATLSLLIPIVALIAVFTFVSIASWAERYAREREAFYRADVLKKVADATGDGAQRVIELLQDEARRAERERVEGLRLGGLVTTCVGIGLGAMLGLLVPGGALWSIGLIPLLVGLALLVHAYVVLPRSRTAAQP